MANAHLYDCANNRIWTQLLLNYLLHRCGQPYTIPAVPNGLAAVVRYCQSVADYPHPGTPAYRVAMRPAIQVIQDGQRYYQALCEFEHSPSLAFA